MRQELYKFIEGKLAWAYTSGDVAVEYLTESYEPLPMSRSATGQKNELARANLEVKIPIESDISERWLQNIMDIAVTLTIFEKTDAGVQTIWKGRLIQAKASGSITTLYFESVYTSLKRYGLRRMYQRSCPYMLYGRGCRLIRGVFTNWREVGDVAGKVITLVDAAQDDDYFTGGIFQYGESMRFIHSHIGNTITLMRELPTLSEDFTLYDSLLCRVYPGCDRSYETCRDKFNNEPNFGGFPQIPERQPKLRSGF